MEGIYEITKQQKKFLELLSEKYPNRQSVFTEIINLQAISNLPKGTEHFISDLHGEYKPFLHILNNCSGVIAEKVDILFGKKLDKKEKAEFCTLIYYPKEKIREISKEERDTPQWYHETLKNMIQLSQLLSAKYTRSKVRKALPKAFNYIIDELLHAQPDEYNNGEVYHEKIIDSIIETESGKEFIYALAAFIKRLAVDRLHVVGDIFDRGDGADQILDLLIKYHSLDIQWGNHDVLWMGATAGSEACIATVLRNNIKYGNTGILESRYGISLRNLTRFAENTYNCKSILEATHKAVNVLLFKLENQVIRRHPEYNMDDRLLLEHINAKNQTVIINEKEYKINSFDFPTVDWNNPSKLSEQEEEIIRELKASFTGSIQLQKHIDFLYEKGSVYKCYNQNLLFHGCIPLDKEGNFRAVTFGGRMYHGKSYMDYIDRKIRQAYTEREQDNLDFMWYLWRGSNSPLSGRQVKTFEREYLNDESLLSEPKDYYYTYCNNEVTCNMILHEFGLYGEHSHIINGHTPVRAAKGESPVKANGKLIVIDGGFCKAYHNSTGIAGYTLIYNSHGMRIKAHESFDDEEKAIKENIDIQSSSDIFETEQMRVMVSDTDDGEIIKGKIKDLSLLLQAYREGILKEHTVN